MDGCPRRWRTCRPLETLPARARVLQLQLGFLPPFTSYVSQPQRQAT